MGAGHGCWVGDGPGRLGVAVDAVGAGAEHGQALAHILLQFQRAGHDKLLVAAPGAGGAVERHRDFADGDEAEPRVDGAQGVKALQQVAGGVGVVPVVATVIHRGVVAGFLRQGAGVLHQVVAGEQNLKDRIAKGLVLAAHGDGRGHLAHRLCSCPWNARQERRMPALIAGRLGQVFALKEGADGGRKFGSQVVFGQ